MRIVDQNTGINLASHNIPYGSNLFFMNGDKVKKGEVICSWDPYNAVIVSEVAGKLRFVNIEEGKTFRVESDEQTGYFEKVIIEARQKIKKIHQ